MKIYSVRQGWAQKSLDFAVIARKQLFCRSLSKTIFPPMQEKSTVKVNQTYGFWRFHVYPPMKMKMLEKMSKKWLRLNSSTFWHIYSAASSKWPASAISAIRRLYAHIMRSPPRMSPRIMRLIPRGPKGLRARPIGCKRTYPSRAHEPEGRVAQAGGRSPTNISRRQTCLRLV